MKFGIYRPYSEQELRHPPPAMPPLHLPPRFLLPSGTTRRGLLHFCRNYSASSSPRPSPTDKIFIALSSGIDSTVTTSLLLRHHPRENLHPIYLANWEPSQHPTSSAPKLGPYGKPLSADAASPQPEKQKCVDREFSRVQQICEHFGLPNKPLRLSFEKEYWNDVFEPMLNAYASGVTPNPDIGCNREVKFGALAKTLSDMAGGRNWWLATGHYARADAAGRLYRSADKRKDQTYFLSTVTAEVLKHCLFPLGAEGLLKTEVKEQAKKLAVPGWREGEETGESFGLCFVEPAGGRNSGFRRFLGEYLQPDPGYFVVGESRESWPSGEKINMPSAGSVVGTHEGLWHATIGEKARLELPQGLPMFQGRWFVSRKDRRRNTIEIVKGGDNRALFSKSMVIDDWYWHGNDAEAAATRHQPRPAETAEGETWEKGLVTQFRHMQRPIRVREVRVLGEGRKMGTKRIMISFDTPQKSVAEGQNAALWDGERCLGGGVIEEMEAV
ncbi:tRNA-specific 2-thiouridylase [Tricharina praecox]|uniref:tRNA-specific 2-thiouridylase n=1 Tax=Tricharina praecox TaxID=43433 RepID=UPI00221EDBDC|nr:tRNA-specific 2-thiouridylase [Tricharina praecox]KAI5851805.1 tRNA-specific 2-thiouridylase [Tricharina praecox]